MKALNRRGGSFSELTYGQGSKLVLQLFEAVQDRGGDASDLVRMLDDKQLSGRLADVLVDGWCVVESTIPVISPERGCDTNAVIGSVQALGSGTGSIRVDSHLARTIRGSRNDILRWFGGKRISACVCRLTRDMTVEQITDRANGSRSFRTDRQTLWEFLVAVSFGHLAGKPCLCLDQFAGESTRPERMLRPYWDGKRTIDGVNGKTVIEKGSYVLLFPADL